MAEAELPTGVVDEWGVLFAGYAPWPFPKLGDTFAAASTVSFFRVGDRRIVHDPGFVPHRNVILDPLRDRGVAAPEVTDVIISHHHPDHTLNIALFEDATTHDVWGQYRNDQWTFRFAEGVDVAPGVKLIQTPGHTDQDITVLVNTSDGLVAFSHLWWGPEIPSDDDPMGTNHEAFHLSRERVLGLSHPDRAV
jgi:glyoxylase-like metal-dependent hydrolase (beta-lactamase superfamily II)